MMNYIAVGSLAFLCGWWLGGGLAWWRRRRLDRKIIANLKDDKGWPEYQRTTLPMPSWRREHYTRTGEAIPQFYVDQGWHYCEDWDGLVVGPGSDEWDCCTCYPEKRGENCE